MAMEFYNSTVDCFHHKYNSEQLLSHIAKHRSCFFPQDSKLF